MEKEKIIEIIEKILWTDEDTVANCNYDDQPNEAFDKGAAWMRKRIIEAINTGG